MNEFEPWKTPEKKIKDSLPERKTVDASEGLHALAGIRQKMGNVLKKDQALKISMYTPEKMERKEGDTWEVDGKMWERRGGINMSISKLKDAKTPYFCPMPDCGKMLNGKADNRMWMLRGKCHVCVIKEETEMRANGTWEEHERTVMRANCVARLKDSIDELTSLKSTIANPQIHFQDGRFEEWSVDMSKVKNDIQEEIESQTKKLAGFLNAE